MRQGILLELCLEVIKGDIASDRFKELWIESGVPLEGEEFEVANQILMKAQERGTEISKKVRSVH